MINLCNVAFRDTTICNIMFPFWAKYRQFELISTLFYLFTLPFFFSQDHF